MTDQVDITQRLNRFLAEVEPDRKGTVEKYEPITGGYSRIIGKAEIAWADGTHETVIVRGDPEQESVFISDRDTEWRILQALDEVEEIATPRPLWYDSTGEYFGTKCIITDFSEGRNLHAILQEADDLDQWAARFVETVAAIHRVPVDALPAQLQFDGSWDEYIDGVIDQYERAERALTTSIPTLRYVGRFLRDHRPPPAELTLCHGDATPGNMLMSEGAPPVIIDWEFAHVGDPREELGYYAQQPLAPNLYHLDKESYLARYREATGLTEEQVNVDTVDYFRMIGMAPLMIQMAEGADSVATGAGSGVLANYLINAVSFQAGEFLAACRRLS